MEFSLVKNLRLVGVAERGELTERVILKVRQATNLGKYAIVQARVSADGFDPVNRLSYWFPDIQVAVGDYVLLYTSPGENGKHVDKEGDTLHVFHWGLSKSPWLNGRDPVVVYISSIGQR